MKAIHAGKLPHQIEIDGLKHPQHGYSHLVDLGLVDPLPTEGFADRMTGTSPQLTFDANVTPFRNRTVRARFEGRVHIHSAFALCAS